MIVLLLLAQLAVTDGDTLKAPWGERYRLHGIDAPEHVGGRIHGAVDLEKGTKVWAVTGAFSREADY